MAKIKSALELALERTENIQSDKGSIERSKLQKEGKLLAGRYLSGEITLEEVKAKIEKLETDTASHFKDGFKQIIVANIKLPRDESDLSTINTIGEILGVIFKTTQEAVYMIEQIKQFYGQYLQNKDQMTMQLKQQYLPQHQQKMAKLQEQFGTPVDLDIEQDPEFIKLLQDNQAQLDAHFQGALDQAKTELGRMD